MFMSKKNVGFMPKYRFPEFKLQKSWDVRDLGSVTEVVSHKNTKGDRYPVYSINNKEGFLPQSEQFEGVDSNSRGFDIKLYKIVGKHTFAYNPARINIGSIGYSGELHDIIISSLYVCFKTNDETDDSFFRQFLSTSAFSRQVENNTEGGIRSYLFYANFSNILAAFPCIEEQQKIADCLTSLDELIAAENKKLEALKAHKKGLMQKLFPSEGETVPDLRFPEFQYSGKWEKRKLSEVTSYVDYRGKTPLKSESGIFLITAKNIRMGYIDYLTSQEFIPAGNYTTVMSRGLPAIGDVIITTEAPVGNVAQIDRENIALAQRIIKYCGIATKLDNAFLKFTLMSPKFQSGLLSKSTGGIVKGIKGSVLHGMMIDVPQLKEQQKIANFLSAADDKITAQSERIEALKLHKKGLMQGLFPSV